MDQSDLMIMMTQFGDSRTDMLINYCLSLSFPIPVGTNCQGLGMEGELPCLIEM